MADRSPPEGHERRAKLLEAHFTGRISASDAAERLASLSLEENPEAGLSCTWASITLVARESDEHLEKLADVLVNMSRLPAAKDANGHPLMMYGMRVWADLPMLGWEFSDEWNSLVLPDEISRRQESISNFVTVNKLAALLMRSGAEWCSAFDVFAIYTMRDAVETRVKNPKLQGLDAYIPAAAAWIDTIGAEMYSWDREIPYGGAQGDPGRGGPLWNGQHGPCRERWKLWRSQFKELSRSDQLSEELKRLARDAEAQMAAIED